MPETIKIIVKGSIPKGVYAKDIILYIIKKIGADGATYKAIEFCGPVIDKLSMDGRFTMSNMAVEMGAKVGFMPVDAKTMRFLSDKSVAKHKIKPVSADKDATYQETVEFDISKIAPQVAQPHTVDNVCDVTALKNKSVDEAYLGTCTNARLEDLKVAVRILKSKKIAKGMKFIVAPSSRSIYLEAIKLGLIEKLVRSGAVVVSPGCGPCVGTHNGVPADGEVVISTANRNFKGRMGNPNAYIYLASPATVTATAITGRITDPRRFLVNNPGGLSWK